MKKIISFILTLAMVMSLSSVPVFASGTITSTDEGSNSASQSVTATYIPDCEATWGTDENQSAFGSLTEAIAAAKDDSSITYIQLQDDLNLSNTIEITGGTFTLDLNGKKITYAGRVIAVNGDNAKVTFADSASDGKVISTKDGFGAVGILKGEVVFSGGTYQGSTGLDIRGGTAVTINGGIFTSTADERMLDEGGFAAISAQNIDLCINGGTFNGLYKIMMYDSSVTIKQCDFAGEEVTTVRYVSGKLDLSGYTGKITKLTVYNGVSTDAISDSNVALPENYGLSTDGENTVDTLTADTKYSIISTTGESQDAIIKGVSVEVDGKTYTSGNVTLTPDSGNVTIKVSGTDFSKLDDNDNKLLYVDGSSVGVSEASGWTVDTTNNTASKTFELSKFQNCTTAFEIKYSNEGDDSDKYKGSDIYIVYQNETVSVGITWGAMNFTYSDEKVDDSDKGWTCETGANTVKVENSGDKSIVAGISYKQAEGYTAISGTFDKTFATIAKDGDATFTLTLSGKPDAKLNGATIGTVTVAITDTINVASASDLKTALASGGEIKLSGDISYTASSENTSLWENAFEVSGTEPVVLDLNGHILSATNCYALVVSKGSTLTINDSVGTGKVEGLKGDGTKAVASVVCQGTVTVNGGTYQSVGMQFFVEDGSNVTINSGTIDCMNQGGTSTLTINGGTVNVENPYRDILLGSVTITGGIFNFDPTDYVDTNNYAVTQNGNTYMVTAKQNN